MSTLPDHVLINRAAWTTANAAYTHGSARAAWAQEEITWGHLRAGTLGSEVAGRGDLESA